MANPGGDGPQKPEKGPDAGTPKAAADRPVVPPNEQREAHRAMQPTGAIDHVAGAAPTITHGETNAKGAEAALIERAKDDAIRVQYDLQRGPNPSATRYDSLPEETRARMRRNLDRYPTDLTHELMDGGDAALRGGLVYEHNKNIKNPAAPLESRMRSAMSLASMDPKDNIMLDAQKGAWDKMTPEQQKATVDEAMNTPPGERQKVLDQARKEGRYTGLLEISKGSLEHFATAADPAKEEAIAKKIGETRESREMRTMNNLRTTLVNGVNTEDARKTAQEVVDDVKKSLNPKDANGRPPSPEDYTKVANGLHERAEKMEDGQKKSTLQAAERMLREAGKDLGQHEQATQESMRGSSRDAIDLLRKAKTGETQGLDAVTESGVRQRMEAKLEERRTAGTLADDAKNPDEMRKQLGITEEQLKKLDTASKTRLAEELKEKLSGKSGGILMAADYAEAVAKAVFGLPH